jgi:hypothetical protein
VRGVSFPIERGTPLADAVSRAQSASDARAADVAYQDAYRLADRTAAPWIARDHVTSLVVHRAYVIARTRCAAFLVDFPDDQILRLTSAEIYCAGGDADGAAADADLVGTPPEAVDRARLHRVRGLVAADRTEFADAGRHLAAARELFTEAGHDPGVAAVDRDLILLGVRRGEAGMLEAALALPRPWTFADRLLMARALKRVARYSAAKALLENVDLELDPAHEPVLRAELAELGVLLRQDAAVPDTEPASPRIDRRLQDVLRVLEVCRSRIDERPVEAETLAAQATSVLDGLSESVDTDAERAIWHQAAGEVAMARHELFDRARADTAELTATADGAEHHFRRAAAFADSAALAELRMVAIRWLGRARWRLGAGAEALDHWHDAYGMADDIARRQDRDEDQARMLYAAPDEHDEWLASAAAAIERHGVYATGGVAVAIEAGHGQSIADVLGAERGGLPGPNDLAGAYRWVRELTRDLPRTQVVWLTHAGPDRVYHVLLGRNLLVHKATRPRAHFRQHLAGTVATLRSCWWESTLEPSVRSGEFDQALAEIAEMLDLDAILPALRRRSRVAVVAGGILSHVPIAALPIPGTDERIVHRFAVSDLPTLSARRPLAHRGVRRRGERSLLVQPTEPTFSPAAPPSALRPVERLLGRRLSTRLLGQDVLDGVDATVERMAASVAGRRLVRVDSHGTFADGAATLKLTGAPLRQEDVRAMDLRRCGTLVLGACDSGQAARLGRDEPVGLARAALAAGAAAVLAARWLGEEPVTGALLDRFDRYVRYLPRDVALQRAQLDVCAGRTPHEGLPEHPARWACWTVYGDPGWQNGPVLRWLRSRQARQDPAAMPATDASGVT